MERFPYIRGVRLRRPLEAEAAEAYMFQLPAIRHLGELAFTQPVTFFAGENGAGKSTLLEAMAVSYGFNPEGGTINFAFASKETHSRLHRYLTLVKSASRAKDGFFLRAESFYNVATEIDRLDEDAPLLSSYGGESLHCLSHGESFMALMQNRFGGQGLYLLDEPEAALSPTRQMALLALIHQLVKAQSQLLICTHSPILLAYPHAEIYVLGENGIQKTPYRETEHFLLTKQFMDCPERMLKYLLEE